MKICNALLTTFLVLFLWGCQSGDMMNTAIFTERFNTVCENFKVDTEKIKSQEINDEIKYTSVLSSSGSDGKFLLTLYASPGTLNINSCSVTYYNDNKDSKGKNNGIKQFGQLKLIATAAVEAFTKESEDHAQRLLKDLGFDGKNYPIEISKYKEEQWYRYSLISNDAGTTFKIESVRLCPATAPNLTLRDQ